MKSVTYTTFSQQIFGSKLLLTLIWTIYIYTKKKKKIWQNFSHLLMWQIDIGK